VDRRRFAIDLHLGHQTREHADIDVLILHEDQLALRRELTGWDLHAADPPGSLRRWQSGEVLPTEVNDIWCRSNPMSPLGLQIMIDDATDGVWTYRRDTRIHRAVVHRTALPPTWTAGSSRPRCSCCRSARTRDRRTRRTCSPCISTWTHPEETASGVSHADVPWPQQAGAERMRVSGRRRRAGGRGLRQGCW
jgi:hypothetical protein